MRRKEFNILILLLVLCAIVAFMNPQFLSAANVQNTSRLIGTYGIFSIGVGIVVITGGIDLSVGSMFALLGVLLSMMLTEWHWPAALVVAVIVRSRRQPGFTSRPAHHEIAASAVHRHIVRVAPLQGPRAVYRRRQ